MTPGDIRDVLIIERASFGDDAWSEKDFRWALNQRSIRSAVMLDKSSVIVGFVLWGEMDIGGVEVMNIAVAPVFRRIGVGTELLAVVSVNSVTPIRTRVLEDDLEAQLFLRSCGYVCVKIKDFEDVTWYHFEYEEMV
jgi:ribosomal protein S18 acetylase RimI-like enzyme